jgi:hypothetical protein
MAIILIESFDLKDLREYECVVCLEETPLVLGEKWQVCGQFHFIKTKTICRTGPTIDRPISVQLPHPLQ